VSALDPEGGLHGIKLFEFDRDGRFVSATRARSGRVDGQGSWLLEGVDRRLLGAADSQRDIGIERLDHWSWSTGITSEMLSAALMQPDKMPTLDLFIYIRHLKANSQNAQRYEIEFWRKVFYPLSCLVMVVLALPFAYLHFRSSGVAGYVFLGVMLGMSFYMLNNLFGYIGNLRAWQPWLAAASPAIVYSLGSLGAFGWLVLRR
jgi:lipopolysaccharide export system permease protein